MNRDDVVRAICEAIERANELRDPGDRLGSSEETVLYGTEGSLDSLNLVSLILDVEQAINDATGRELVLADERAMAMRRNPFRDVRSFADHVAARLAEGVACPNPPSC